MKTKILKFRLLQRALVVLAGTVLIPGAVSLRAADDLLINGFDTAGEASGWQRWWGSALQTYEWDGTMDADSNPNSGALKATIVFDKVLYGGDNQFAVRKDFGTVDGAQYTNLVFDLFWDPNSPQRSFGDFGYMEPGFRNQDFTQNWLPGFAVSTTPGWQHIVLRIDGTAPKIETIAGVVLKMWSGDPTWGQTGTAIFWVDNVKLIAKQGEAPPPPTLYAEKTIPGLRVFASAAGAQYQRQNIRTVGNQYSWVGASQPVTYSITIRDYPGGTYNNFQTHLFIVPGTALPTWETAPDWNEPNVVFLNLGNNANGSGYAVFRYKTNQPNGNSTFYTTSGSIASIGSPQMRGTWSLTFDPGGQISLTSPSGANTNFAMPPEAVSLFTGPAYAYVGVQPNSLANIGQSVTFARIEISGLANPIDESFSSATLPSTLEVVADHTAGILPVPPEAVMWLNWSLPDRGFSLEYTDGLDEGDDFGVPFTIWNPLTVTPAQIGGLKRALIFPNADPAKTKAFFRMKSGP
jgi:hypothetical protein